MRGARRFGRAGGERGFRFGGGAQRAAERLSLRTLGPRHKDYREAVQRRLEEAGLPALARRAPPESGKSQQPPALAHGVSSALSLSSLEGMCKPPGWWEHRLFGPRCIPCNATKAKMSCAGGPGSLGLGVSGLRVSRPRVESSIMRAGDRSVGRAARRTYVKSEDVHVPIGVRPRSVRQAFRVDRQTDGWADCARHTCNVARAAMLPCPASVPGPGEAGPDCRGVQDARRPGEEEDGGGPRLRVRGGWDKVFSGAPLA